MIKDQRDFWAGVLFSAFGAFFCFYAVANYPLGTASRMGPGYFPMLLGGFLLFLGVLISLKSFFFPPHDGTGIGPFDWRVVFVILGFCFASAPCRFNSGHGCDGIYFFFCQPKLQNCSRHRTFYHSKHRSLAYFRPRFRFNRAYLALLFE